MSIQTDILDTIGDGGIEVAALRGKLGNVGANELDCAVNALLRARRLQISFGRYELIPSTRLVGQMPTRKPPSAEEEAAASLLPADRVCVTCKGEPKALHQFRVVGPGEKHSNECNDCYRKRPRVKRTLADIRVSAPVVVHWAERDNGVEALKVGHQTVNLASTPLIAGSSPANSTTSNSSSSQRLSPQAGIPEEATAGPAAPCADASVFDRVTLQRQAGLNKIALLEVELANARAYVAERERFLADYQRFSAEEKA